MKESCGKSSPLQRPDGPVRKPGQPTSPMYDYGRNQVVMVSLTGMTEATHLIDQQVCPALVYCGINLDMRTSDTSTGNFTVAAKRYHLQCVVA